MGRPPKNQIDPLGQIDEALDYAKGLYCSFQKESVVADDYMHFNEADTIVKEFVSTGIPELDLAMGGGNPVGQIIEIFGDPASGKSTLGYSFGKHWQDCGGIVISIDTEHSWDEDRFEQIGGRRDKVIRLEADTVEQIFTFIWLSIKKQMDSKLKGKEIPTLIVVDTVAAADTAEDMAATIQGKEESGYGLQKAKFLSKNVRKLPRMVGSLKMTIVFVNQTRENIKSFGNGPDWVVPGGKAIPFYSTSRLHIRSIGRIIESGIPIGQKVRIETEKCKTAPPHRKIEVDLVYETGLFDATLSKIQALKDAKLIRMTKNGYKILSSVLIRTFNFPELIPRTDEGTTQLKKLITENWKELKEFIATGEISDDDVSDSASLMGVPEETEDGGRIADEGKEQ